MMPAALTAFPILICASCREDELPRELPAGVGQFAVESAGQFHPAGTLGNIRYMLPRCAFEPEPWDSLRS